MRISDEMVWAFEKACRELTGDYLNVDDDTVEEALSEALLAGGFKEEEQIEEYQNGDVMKRIRLAGPYGPWEQKT